MTYLHRLLSAAAVSTVLTLAGAGVARADEPAASSVPHPFAYGILVGTNVGGAGQQTLRYAEDDARKMADVLRQLGRYGSADLRVLVRPDGAHLLAAIDEVAAKMRVHQAKGEQAVLVFYYSGHARAGSFSLGGEELAVTALREKLRQIPRCCHELRMSLAVLRAHHPRNLRARDWLRRRPGRSELPHVVR